MGGPVTGSAVATEVAPRGYASSGAVVAVLSTATLLVNLDLFIVNIGFPSIQREFAGASLATLSWVLNAYAIVFAAFLVPAGRLADRYGRRAGFLLGLAVFVLGSAGCALAPDAAALIAARAAQAAGGALIIPASLSLLLAAVPAERRAKAIGTWVAVGATAAGAGPVVGGLLVKASWRWIFVVNLPIGLLALVAAARVVPESRDRAPGRFPDLPGTGLLVLGVGALALGLVKGPVWGWTSRDELVTAAVTAGALLAFVARSARHPSPVVDPSLLRTRSFGLTALGLLVFTCSFSALVLGSVLFLTRIWGYSSVEAGFAIAPSPLVVPLVARGVAAALARRYGPHRVAVAGNLLLAAGAACWALSLGAARSYPADLLPGLLLSGAGVGLALPSLTTIGVSGLPAERFATGSAVLNMFRQVGAVLGIAVLVAIVDSARPGRVVHAFTTAWTSMAAVAVGAAVLAAAIGRTREPA
ncbi:MAG: MFS transporter [Mycobacteriales bacterium]